MAGRDVLFFGGQSIQSSLTAQDQEAYRDGVPDAGKPTRTSLHFGAPGARLGQVLFDARPGRSRSRLHPAPRTECSTSTAMLSASKKTGTMGQLYSSDAFFSYSVIIHSKPEFAVSLAPCTTRGSRGASKKKVLVHGLMQRAPRLVGCSREYVFTKPW